MALATAYFLYYVWLSTVKKEPLMLKPDNLMQEAGTNFSQLDCIYAISPIHITSSHEICTVYHFCLVYQIVEL